MGPAELYADVTPGSDRNRVSSPYLDLVKNVQQKREIKIVGPLLINI